MNTLKELYLEAARVAELEEQYPGIYPIKFHGNCYDVDSLINGIIDWLPYISEIEFALAVVENKACFKGDVLYDHNPAHKESPMFTAEDIHSNYMSSTVSWNPPKSRTVMVELLVEDAKWMMDYPSQRSLEISEACRKALGGLKS